MRKPFTTLLLGSLSCGLCSFGFPGRAVAQVAPLPLRKAGAATELPLGAWGPYARTHRGPCYLASRLPAQLFTFPIVIGQRRFETVLRSEKTAGGQARLRVEDVILARRAMGLSPVQAGADDRNKSPLNRQARILEADADGLFWSAQISFAPAPLTQTVSAPPDESGKPAPPPTWGAGEARVECFPAFADPDADGLLVRVSLTNSAETLQTYFVDLLGGIDILGEQFPLKDLAVTLDTESQGVLMKHAQSDTVFALAAQAAFPIRSYRVTNAYFAPESAMTPHEATGVVRPAGRLEIPGPDDGSKERKAPEAAAADAGLWGLTRVDDIAVAPGQTVTLFLCVGVGKDDETARHSAHILLHLSEDRMPKGKPAQEGLSARARRAHEAAAFHAGEAALNRLMAQSLTNLPFNNWRRVGVPSRQSTRGRPGGWYQPGVSGMIALGWSLYRPDWAAAQLNAWFVTNGDALATIKEPQAVFPGDLFALWELAQQTRDREMLTQFFPFARRRYREFLAAGRLPNDSWLFAWPEGISPVGEGRANAAGTVPAVRMAAPDYSAYVIRAAKIMRAMAERVGRPDEEIQDYLRDADEATKALDSALWDPARGSYTARPAAGAESPAALVGTPASADTLQSLLPLIAGSETRTPEQRAALLKSLTDPARFWSPFGLCSVARSSPAYRSGVQDHGAISVGQNWMLWKALLDLGEAETARKLAAALVQAYSAAQAASGGCPEWLDGETGAAGGAGDYSGDTCALLPLYAAYHTPGTVSSGWDLQRLDQRYDGATDTMRVVFRAHLNTGKGLLLCVMGKPNGKYTLSGTLTGTATADANGALTLTTPADTTTQAVDIAPAGSAL
jgi:hypothetical protein